MRIDIREKIKDSFLYKRFAYRQSEGFIALMKFLEDENIVDEFYKECNFRSLLLLNELKVYKRDVTIRRFFAQHKFSFTFSNSYRGYEFWYDKIFKNKNFEKIENKLL